MDTPVNRDIDRLKDGQLGISHSVKVPRLKYGRHYYLDTLVRLHICIA